MIEILKDCLNQRLKYATEGTQETLRDWYNQAYGMIYLFLNLHPELEAEVATLWENTYRPAFDEIFLR